MLEVDRQSGGFIACNACAACPVAPEDGTGVGSGNPTGVNSFSACLRAPREIHISDSAAYFTGVAKNDRIGEDRLNLLNRSDVIPLGSTLCNACPVEFPDLPGSPLACPVATTRGNDPVSEKTIASVALNPIPIDQVWARGIQQGGHISLGFYHSSKKFLQKLH